jgi:hypothetical protein
MKPILGYSLKGTRLKTAVHSHRKNKWTLLMAVSSGRVVGYDIFKGSCNSAKFIEFLSNLDMTGKRYLMMDNVAFHKTKAVASVIATKNVEALFLPPYSPEFQPIECIFSMVKAQYRHLPCAVDHTLEDDGERSNGGRSRPPLRARLQSAKRFAAHVFMRVMYSIDCIEPDVLFKTFQHCWRA